MTQLGQYPPPSHTIAHFSDPHFLAEDRLLFDAVDTGRNLTQALDQLERSGTVPDAIIFTGDLADRGEPGAYRRLREIVDPAADRMGTRIIWVMGNHDERAPFREELLSDGDSNSGDGNSDSGDSGDSGDSRDSRDIPPLDRAYDLGGLRLIALDTTVPGYHHGNLTDEQLAWLGNELATPAPLGTIIAMHHPPIPTPIEVMAILELQRQDRLADVLRGTDVRGILAGHLHYSTHSTFAGIPVSVSSATCYTLDVSGPPHTFTGVSGGQAFTLVGVYDTQLVHSIVPLGNHPLVTGFSQRFLENISALSSEERLETFSSKSSPFSIDDIERREARRF